MKLRYIKNLFYYDRALCDLFIENDGLGLYITLTTRGDDAIVRKMDESVKMGLPNGINFPNGSGGFFDTINGADFFIFAYKDFTETKEWGENFPYWTVEARPITDEERVKYADDSPYWKTPDNWS